MLFQTPSLNQKTNVLLQGKIQTEIDTEKVLAAISVKVEKNWQWIGYFKVYLVTIFKVLYTYMYLFIAIKRYRYMLLSPALWPLHCHLWQFYNPPVIFCSPDCFIDELTLKPKLSVWVRIEINKVQKKVWLEFYCLFPTNNITG